MVSHLISNNETNARISFEKNACDDCVISTGQKPSDYAQQLVQIAGPNVDKIAADSTYIPNVDRFNHDGYAVTNAKGEILFSALIPGANYRITAYENGRFKSIKDFVAESGKTLDLVS